MKNICSVTGCLRDAHGGGLCTMHYQQMRRGRLPEMRMLPREGPNVYTVEDGVVSLKLCDRRGREVSQCIIDLEDLTVVAGYHWGVVVRPHTIYVVATDRSTHQTTYLHRIVMNAPAGVEVDHVDGDGLNNRRQNLRFATRLEQMQNVARAGRELFRGVSYNPRAASKALPWIAQAQVAGVRHYVGHFATEIEAREVVSAFRETIMSRTNEARHRSV